MAEQVEFKVRINKGTEVLSVFVQTDNVTTCASALPAMLGIDLPAEVEIWPEALMPEYEPVAFRLDYAATGVSVKQLTS